MRHHFEGCGKQVCRKYTKGLLHLLCESTLQACSMTVTWYVTEEHLMSLQHYTRMFWCSKDKTDLFHYDWWAVVQSTLTAEYGSSHLLATLQRFFGDV